MVFLIEYDRREGRLINLRKFQDHELGAAETVRLDVEVRLNRDGIDHEVVLLQAVNEEALRATHRRYFEDLPALATPTGRLGGRPSSS